MANYTITTLSDSGDDQTSAGSLAADTADGGGLSLREALLLANTTAGADTINFDAALSGGTITLIAGELVLSEDTTIDGDVNADNVADITIDGNDTSRIFQITGGTSTLDTLVITNGRAVTGGGPDRGAGINLVDNSGADVTITNSSLSSHVADFGGAIFAGANTTLTLTGSVLTSNNSTFGGGGLMINGGATATVVNTTIETNSTTAYHGGGVYTNPNSTLTVIDSTISGNTAAGNGGGIRNYGTFIATNTTIANNTAGGSGGGIEIGGTSGILGVSTTLTNVTVTGNNATTTGDGINARSGTNILVNSIVLGNQGSETAGAAAITNTTSIISGTVADVFAAVDGVTGGGQLANNGGTVQTVALKTDITNPALDAGDDTRLVEATAGVDFNGDGDTADTLTTDANGNARQVDQAAAANNGANTVDLGAVEAPALPEADSLIVTIVGDTVNAFDGETSLREAVTFANSNADASTITFDAALAGGTIILTNGALNLSEAVTIDGDVDGDNKADITISGNNASQIFSITVNTDLLSLDITAGNSTGGGAIRHAGGILNLLDSTVRDSTAGSGEGGQGGGVYSKATLNITNSTITGNYGYYGGGLFVLGTATITNTTIDGNSAGFGGGIYNDGTTEVINSTITNNSGFDDGGGAYNIGSLGVQNTVVALNSAGTGSSIQNFGSLTAQNSFFGDTVTINTDNGGNLNNAGDPLLGALADNGGTVNTRQVLAGSQLIDAGDDTLVPVGIVTDANGNTRFVNTVDIGATEAQPEADSLIVTIAGDTVDAFDGETSLREAVSFANSNADASTITFDAALNGSTITLTTGELVLSQDTTIDGDVDADDKADISVSGNNASRVFNVTGATTDATFQSLTIENGTTANRGGAIFASNISSLTVENSTLANNTAVEGGGLYASYSNVDITNSTISGNNSTNLGGGMLLYTSSATLINTTVHNNTSTTFGGGIAHYGYFGNTLTLINSTVTDNHANSSGSISGSGGGLSLFDGTATLYNTVIAGNVAGLGAGVGDDVTNAAGNPTALSVNSSFFGTAIAGPYTDNGSNINGGGDPMLGALTDNGGSVQTQNIQFGSLLIDAGLNAAVPGGVTTDANGDARIQSGNVDIGADEFTNAAPTFNATLTSLTAAFTFDGDDAGDRFGRSVSAAGDVNGDGFDDVIVGARNDDNNGLAESGSARVLSGVDGAVLFTFDGDGAGDNFGFSVSSAGDVNGDGFDDVIVGARHDDNNGSSSGSARVLSGVDGAVLFTFDGDSANDFFGSSVSAAGDVNGDGFDDVIIGANGDDNNGNFSGSARVLSGIDGAVLFTFDGDDAGDAFGISVSSAGDVNGDGFDDVIVGASVDDNNGYNSGSARVLSGVDGAVLFVFDGDAYDYFGRSVSSAGDVNGDGFDDVIVGAFGDDNNGSSSGSARVLSGVDGTVLFTFDGDDADDQFGRSVSSAGDVNGDGFDDLIVGAYLDDNNGSRSGSARVLSGVDGAVLFTFDGDSANDRFGYSVSSAGDVNGDGFADVIVGAFLDDNNGSASGSARLFVSSAVGTLDPSRDFTEGDAAVVLDNDVAVADADFDALNGGNGDYDGASLNIQRQGGGNADDLFDFAAMANVTVNSGNLEVGGFAIATFTAVGGVLNISFTNANSATPNTALVNEILQAVTYENSDTDIALGEQELLPLEWTFSDGSSNLTDTINISHSGIGGRVLTGTPADDTLDATLGDDTVDGLAANDTLDFDAATAGVTVNLNLTGPQVTGGSGTDTIINIEHLSGGSGNDRFIGTVGVNTLSGEGASDQLFGLGGNDTLNGGQGNDIALAGAGNDTLNGDDGDDILKGGNDNDTLTGGVGRDQLYGEAGADTFAFNDVSETGLVYADRDIIRDFSQADGDLIDLSGIDADTSTMADDAFTFLGTFPSTIPSIPFTNVAGQLFAVNTAGGQTVVWGDVDGDGTQDFTFVLDGALALTDSDFIL